MMGEYETERQRIDMSAIACAARRYAKDVTVQAVARGTFQPSRADGILFLRQPDNAMACTLLTEGNSIVAGWSFLYRPTYVAVDVVWYPLLHTIPLRTMDASGMGAPQTIASMKVPKVTGFVSLCHTLGLCKLPHVQGEAFMPCSDKDEEGLVARWHEIVEAAFFVFSRLH